MSDTVSGAVIVSSLGSDGPTFLSLPDGSDTPALAAVHVHGGAYAEQTSGLMVDFSMLSPDLQVVTPYADPTHPPESVSGYAMAPLPEEPPLGVPGALHHG